MPPVRVLGEAVVVLAERRRETVELLPERHGHGILELRAAHLEDVVELLPYASYYLTGFLNERPLARVREDLAALGLARVEGMSEPEDHLAFLLEIMAGLAAGRFGAEEGAQRRFFDRHLAPWAPRLFADLEQAKAARFYRAVGGLGRVFLDVEAEAFRMET